MEFSLFTTPSGPALGPTQPHIQWIPGVSSSGIKRPRREAHQSPPSNAEAKSAWSCASTPNTLSWRGTYLSTGTTSFYLHPDTVRDHDTTHAPGVNLATGPFETILRLWNIYWSFTFIKM